MSGAVHATEADVVFLQTDMLAWLCDVPDYLCAEPTQCAVFSMQGEAVHVLERWRAKEYPHG
jgi:hypothetical protein